MGRLAKEIGRNVGGIHILLFRLQPVLDDIRLNGLGHVDILDRSEDGFDLGDQVNRSVGITTLRQMRPVAHPFKLVVSGIAGIQIIRRANPFLSRR